MSGQGGGIEPHTPQSVCFRYTITLIYLNLVYILYHIRLSLSSVFQHFFYFFCAVFILCFCQNYLKTAKISKLSKFLTRLALGQQRSRPLFYFRGVCHRPYPFTTPLVVGYLKDNETLPHAFCHSRSKSRPPFLQCYKSKGICGEWGLNPRHRRWCALRSDRCTQRSTRLSYLPHISTLYIYYIILLLVCQAFLKSFLKFFQIFLRAGARPKRIIPPARVFLFYPKSYINN